MSRPIFLPPRIDFYDAKDGRRLAVRNYDAADTPRAHVILLHGISSHGGWYERSCEYLARTGYHAHFLDRRGSGLNQERPGDVDDWQTWIDDVVSYVRRLHGSHPVVLCGISWGGKLAAAVVRRHPWLIQGLALICPGIYSPHDPGIAKRAMLSLGITIRFEERRVRIPLRDPRLFTDSPTWQKYIAHDPLTLREVTWRFARESVRLTRFAQNSATFLHLPTLMMLAGRDRIIDNRRTRGFYGRLPAADKRLIEYANAAHTLEFEPDPQPYFRDLAAWIARVSGCPFCP
jgi:alpha-beta hydrolase superfamily lysophospholipase